MKTNLLTALLCICTLSVFSQSFTVLTFDERPIQTGNGHLRKNAVLSDNKIYYTTLAGSSATAYLTVVNTDGSGLKIFTNTLMEGANFLKATEKFIYYNSYLPAENIYHLYRFNKQTEQVELITNAENGKAWLFNTSYPSVSRMYAFKNKLILAGKFKSNTSGDSRSLCVVEDDAPRAYYLSANLNLFGSDGLSVSLVPRPDEVAVGDSLIAYYEKDIKSNKHLYFSKAATVNGIKKYTPKTKLDFDKYDYDSFNDKVVCRNNIFYFLFSKKNRTGNDLPAYLMQFDGTKFTTLAGLQAEPFGVFMQVIGDDIYMGDLAHVYKYGIKTKNITNLLTLAKGSLAMIQEQELLLPAADGSVFLAFDKHTEQNPTSQFGIRTILSIDAKQKTDTVTSFFYVDMNRSYDTPEPKSLYVIGNDLYQPDFDATQNQVLKVYSKKNNWIPTTVNLPEVQKYAVRPGGNQLLIQLPESFLFQTDYQDKKKKTQKKVLFKVAN